MTSEQEERRPSDAVVRVDADTHHRLRMAAAMKRCTMGQVVAELAKTLPEVSLNFPAIQEGDDA